MDAVIFTLNDPRQPSNGTKYTVRWNSRYQEIYCYRYINQIPLRDTQLALLVNWCELTITKASDD